jgi:hypothetical protein
MGSPFSFWVLGSLRRVDRQRPRPMAPQLGRALYQEEIGDRREIAQKQPKIALSVRHDPTAT